MGGERHIVFGFPTRSGFVADVAVDADSFAKTLCDNFFGVHLDELVFEGRAACVDNKYFHFSEYLQDNFVPCRFLFVEGAAAGGAAAKSKKYFRSCLTFG